MFGTYRKEDVTVLLKDVTGLVTPMPTYEREKLIQNGVHYSAMLPVEYEPSAEYISIYEDALNAFAPLTAQATANVAAKILAYKGNNIVLVSLARAGTPVGILIKRYLREFCGLDVPHYTLSIIRGIGIDKNAVNFILARHNAKDLVFIDGWTGKGAIKRQLDDALRDYPKTEAVLAVLADPAGVAELCGTREDFLIPSSCLNATVSGLLSRTFLRDDLIGKNDFHGAVFYKNLAEKDVTYQFIDKVASFFPAKTTCNHNGVQAANDNSAAVSRCDHNDNACLLSGLAEVAALCREFAVRDINLIKPGIGEATRVLLRRVPRCVLVRNIDDVLYLGHIYRLAKEKSVPVVQYPLQAYRACGIIAAMGDA